MSKLPFEPAATCSLLLGALLVTDKSAVALAGSLTTNPVLATKELLLEIMFTRQLPILLTTWPFESVDVGVVGIVK
jgi:hypothetical protein